ncbi:MAG TPA: hypothetical protein VK590_06060, partial [Saprospiraceae bacterium]|nr:hypothetical protein [Saprospiraceae bacterium]
MVTLKRTDSNDPDLGGLITLLDRELQEYDGEDHKFYHQFNSVDKLKHVVIACHDGIPVACGAVKAFDTESAEIKRMFVLLDYR